MRDVLQAQHHQLREIEGYVQAVMPRLPYHNFNHVMEATAVAYTLATAYSLSANERFSLGAAMRLHDVIYVPGRDNNEELSAGDANRLLRLLGVDDKTIDETLGIILATKPTNKPQTLLQMLGRDADMHNLGTPYFFLSGERFRAEFSPITDDAWYKKTLANIGDFEFYTKPGKMLYTETWNNNREQLRKKISECNQQLAKRN